jgi:hypothetical protein
MCGVLPYGLSVTVHEVHAHFVTTAAIFTNETRSCRHGPRISSITSDLITRFKYIDHSPGGNALFRAA